MPRGSDAVKGVYRAVMIRAIWAIALLRVATAAHADVVDSAAGGFSLKETVKVDVPAAKAWVALIEIGQWWDKDHTYSGDAANLSLEPTANGCFCEQLADGGGVRHATVVNVVPNKLLRMTGGLGPLQDLAVDAVLTVKLTEAGGKTTIELTYKVGGYAPKGLADLAKPVDAVLGAQLERLRKYVASRPTCAEAVARRDADESVRRQAVDGPAQRPARDRGGRVDRRARAAGGPCVRAAPARPRGAREASRSTRGFASAGRGRRRPIAS